MGCVSFIKDIRFRYVCCFLITALVPLLIVGTITYMFSISLVKEKVIDHILTISNLNKEHLNTFLNSKKLTTLNFSSDGLIRDLAKNIIEEDRTHPIRKKNIQELNMHLSKNKISLDSDITNAFVIDLDGRVISSNDERFSEADLSSCDYFKEGKRGLYVSGMCYGENLGSRESSNSGYSTKNKHVIMIASPLKDNANHKLLGVFVNEINKASLLNVINIDNKNGLGKTGEVIILNKDKMMEVGAGFNKSYVSEEKIDDIAIQRCIAGNNGVEIYNDYRDISVVGAYTWLEEPGWGMITKIDSAEAFYPLKRIRNFTIIIAICLFFALMGISILFSRRLSKPIFNISETLKKISFGGFETKTMSQTDDQVGKNMNELDRLVTGIKESYRKILHSDRLASVGRMAAGVAHEVNNPLSVLSGRIQILIENCKNTNLLEEYNKLLSLINRIERTVDGMLYFSRQKTPKFIYTDINTVIEKSIILLEKQMIARGVKIVKNYRSNLPPVKISRDHIEQALFNIILNAFDSMSDKGVLSIRSELSVDGRNILVSFEDNGCGIKDEYVEKVFEPFFSTKSPDKGTGLGLSICYGIIKDHYGNIEIKSREGVGTVFTVSLPVE